MSRHDYDVVVVGGGHNALVAAALLARRGARVALFEARAQLGGFAAPYAVSAGIEAPLAVDDWGLLREDLVGELELGQHGLGWVEGDRLAALHSSAPHARGDGPGEDLALWCDPDRCADAFERDAPGDGARLRRFLGEVGSVLADLEELWRRPPALAELGRLVLSPELMRWCAGSLEELLVATFDGERARTVLAALALRGSSWGPSAAGTGILLLHQLAGTTARGFRPARRPAGGAGSLVRALESAARAAGADLRTSAPVRQILVESGAAGTRATGVRLDDGSEVGARLVVSGLDRKSTLLQLVGAPRLPVQSVRRLLGLRQRGVRSRAFAPATGDESRGAGRQMAGAPLFVVRDLDQLERAADDAKWGRAASRPWLEVSSWPRAGGGATWTVNAQNAPQIDANGSSEGWSAAVRAELSRVAALDAGGWQELGPADWERELGATGGCENHGDMLLDQLFLLRGTERAAGARTEVDGLLLCGSGAHPGGGVTGLPGWHAARLGAEELG